MAGELDAHAIASSWDVAKVSSDSDDASETFQESFFSESVQSSRALSDF